MSTPLLEARSLVKRFGGNVAVDGVSLAIGPGEVVGLVGPNGSGKSTLMNLIMRVERATRGQVLIDGVATDRMGPHRVARLGVHYSFQRTRLLPEVSVEEHLCMALADHSLWWSFGSRVWASGDGRRRAEAAVVEFGLAAVRSQPAAELSFGQRQLLCLAIAAVRQARLVLLDEPLAGLSGESIGLFAARVRQYAASGAALLIVEHRLRSLAEVCGRFVVMNQGRVIADGAPGEVMERPEVVAAYFGRRG